MFFVSTHDAMGSTWITGGLDSLESVLQEIIALAAMAA